MARKTRHALVIALALTFGYGAGRMAEAQSKPRVYELRTYTSHPGKLSNVVARFRDHTTKLFEKHGMKNIGYWVPQDAPLNESTLIYVVSHASRDAAKASWDAFRQDPEWHKARDASEVNGKIVAKVEAVFMDATDFSALK